jgi:phosphatidylinositol alpha-1,6-mannosyltransferase
MPLPRIVFACESLVAGNGGIARVDRLIASVLCENTARWTPDLHVFCDAATTEPKEGLPLRTKSYAGSKLRFAFGVWLAGQSASACVYDAAYYAKVHRLHFGRRGRRNMIFLHGIEVWEQARRGSIAACRRADMLVANSDYTRRRAESCHGNFGRARVCWLATEASALVAGSTGGAGRNQPTALVVGRLDPRGDYKGHRETIEAWPRVVAAHPGARLKIVGRGGLIPRLKELAHECGVAGSVDFTGFLSEQELARAYHGASVFVLPSRCEGFGVVYIEAMRYGLPVIASVHDAAAEVVEHGRTGLLVDLDRSDELPDAITRVFSNPDAAMAMGEAGRDRWQRHFTYDSFRRRFEPLLEELVGGTPAQPG